MQKQTWILIGNHKLFQIKLLIHFKYEYYDQM